MPVGSSGTCTATPACGWRATHATIQAGYATTGDESSMHCGPTWARAANVRPSRPLSTCAGRRSPSSAGTPQGRLGLQPFSGGRAKGAAAGGQACGGGWQGREVNAGKAARAELARAGRVSQGVRNHTQAHATAWAGQRGAPEVPPQRGLEVVNVGIQHALQSQGVGWAGRAGKAGVGEGGGWGGQGGR